MNLKDRLLMLVDIKENGIVSRFERNSMLSTGAIKNITHTMSPETTAKIIKAYPDINKNWLLTGDGEMIIENKLVSEPQAHYKPRNNPPMNPDEYEKRIRELEKQIELLNKIIASTEAHNETLKQSLNDLRKNVEDLRMQTRELTKRKEVENEPIKQTT